ncbi:MAG: hypothetical protein ACI3XA_04850 [Clostridia bacterium]
MKITDEVIANKMINEIYDIICDDNLIDIEAVEEIILVLKKYNVKTENAIDEHK